MYYITQLIHIFPDQEEVFQQYENTVLPLLLQYQGQVVLRLRPTESSFISGLTRPYEVHIISFPTKKEFEAYTQDETRKRFLYLRERSIQTAFSIHGVDES